MSVFSPKKKRDSRERALQFLFGLDFTNYDWESAIEDFWEAYPAADPVRQYAEELIRGVNANLEALDAEIAGAIDKWTPDRIGKIERNILRLALYEMRHCDDVPPAVAINEAIEITKRFASDESPRFINGVLDRLKKG